MSKILAIDDKKDSLIAISALLNVLIPDCNVITAQSGVEGLEKAKTQSPDTILLDIKMPGMDGYEVCNRLKDDETTKHIPVIMISAIKTESEDLVKGLDNGADAYLAKPIDEYVLIAQVKTALRIKKAEDRLREQKDLLERTVQKRTAELLRTNEQLKHEINNRINTEKRYRMLVETMNDGLFLIDENFLIAFANNRLFEILGYPKDKIIGMPVHHFLDVNNQRIFDEQMKLRNKDNHKIYELTFIRKDGQKIPVIVSPSAIIDADGRFKGSLSVITDISERKQLEEQLRQSHKMESIGTMAGGIAHDFNNIIGVIIGNTELALKNVPESNSAHLNLEEIKTAGLRAKNIVRQLFRFTRKTNRKLKPIEIVPVIKDALEFLRSTIPSAIDIRLNIQATDEIIFADITQINQIVMNLCINASHAMEETGGTLEISLLRSDFESRNVESRNVESLNMKSGLEPGRYIKLTVSDTGSGIAPEMIDKIFDPYFTTKEVGKGSGMGLAVVHGIVKNHNGVISIDSQSGKGTAFNILFPLTDEKPEVKTETTEEFLMGNETILFVDDEKPIVTLAQKMLEHLGYKVETALTPLDALERFNSNPDYFDLVITDMTMPQMTGVKLSEKLMDIRKDIPIIICTGYSAIVDEEKAKKLGLAGFVMKPVSMSELSKVIRKALITGKPEQKSTR